MRLVLALFFVTILTTQTFADDDGRTYFATTVGVAVHIPRRLPGITGSGGYPELAMHFQAFSAAQVDLIIDAVKNAMFVVDKPAVLECAYKFGTKGQPTRTAYFEESLRMVKRAIRLNLSFHGESMPGTFAIAHVGSDTRDGNEVTTRAGWYIEDEDAGRFEVRLNNALLGHEYPQAEEWSGIIMHEFLHLMGYAHGGCNEGETRDDCYARVYKNAFVESYGYCVRDEGRFSGFDLYGTAPIFVD